MKSLPKSLSSRSQGLLLILAVFALYHVALTGPIISIDDQGIVDFYGSGRLTLSDVLKPGGGYYYRPVIALSFYLDYLLWGQHPLLLHLENVLLHAANTVLVFLLACRVVPAVSSWLPFLAALLFAAHPANCEAVSWMAGRTDPLAAFFLLLSSLSLCRGLEGGKSRWTLLGVLLMVAGTLAKETALMFMPASLLLVAWWRRLHPEADPGPLKRQQRLLLACYLAICAAVGVLFIYRFAVHANSVSKLFTAGRFDPLGAPLLALEVFGFYLKKMLVPWPLNFATLSLSRWYLIPAVGGVLLLLAPRKNPAYFQLCIGCLFLIPAVVVGVFDVAWTVVAERYLYIPSIFFILGLTAYLRDAAKGLSLRRAAPALALVSLIAASATTFERTCTWNSNLSLFQDAVAKTPEFGMLHNELAVALIRAGRLEEAKKELDVASSLKISPLVQRLVRRNRILLSMEGKPAPEKRRILNEAGLERSLEDTELLNILRLNDYVVLDKMPKGAERDKLVRELIEISEVLFKRTNDAIYPYNNGQLYLDRGDRKQAAESFARSYRASAEGSLYRNPSKRLAENLGERL